MLPTHRKPNNSCSFPLRDLRKAIVGSDFADSDEGDDLYRSSYQSNQVCVKRRQWQQQQ
jgi:hypothetical protein